MKKKKIIYITIIIISLIIIILPPVLRSTNKISKKNKSINQNKLVCTKKNKDNYTIEAIIEYKDEKTKSITLKFINNSKSYTEDDDNSEDRILSESEILERYYATLVGTEYSVYNNTTVVKVTNETKEYYKYDKNIQILFESYKKLREHYEKNQYTCE